jgi:hypothetical protein
MHLRRPDPLLRLIASYASSYRGIAVVHRGLLYHDLTWSEAYLIFWHTTDLMATTLEAHGKTEALAEYLDLTPLNFARFSAVRDLVRDLIWRANVERVGVFVEISSRR